MDNIEIGNRIREIRIKKNISVFELAYRTKTSQSHIYQIEGGSQNMSIELLFKIADTLETDPNTILGVKNNVASVDEALNELPLEMKSKLSVLFGAMINQIKEQDISSLAVLYGICGYLEKAGLIEEKERTSVSIENLLEDENSPGKIFGINRITLNDCLDVLEQDGYLKIDRTAGLDTVYFEESSIKTREKVMEQIYK